MKMALRDVATGEVVAFDWNPAGQFDEKDPAEMAGVEHYWTEGNFGCDCNRELEFRRQKGEDVEWDEVACGDGRFELVEAPWIPAQKKKEATS